ncbi:methyltransferase small [Thioalkalivibrio nitratireducens DSM 14787]|uniref:Methyltransferase small n=1 Tax=Thioalkalivibrio nitratireducens (strain DSM 14787 / UNIQEM 213 / ALEN2) TaxID=1255043 RepID=L0DST4_THIND|nr:methyltransferase [Thioalkalivibrio nitratireducens]AGA32057.1 methyltransferase small [Thioalkalivibrio nitratireducens DSM 14787]
MSDSRWSVRTRAERQRLRKELKADLRFADVLAGERLEFVTTWGLFSPRRIDDGSRLLLEHVEPDPADRCLDLGCGYGPIGLVLARKVPQGHCTLVDKDFVAVDYSRRNAALNRIANVDCLLSNGFDQVAERRFDLVASNLPAKVGRELLYTYLLDAWDQLNPGGRLYAVTITGLRRFIEKGFREVFGNYDKLKQGRDYTVALAVREPD